MALSYFYRGVSADIKRDGTPVTSADLDIEQTLLQELTRFRPGDAVLGEELGERGFSPRGWLLDPIDGTSNFVCGNPQWGTHIALEVERRIVLGVRLIGEWSMNTNPEDFIDETVDSREKGTGRTRQH